jgi:hypothetical protein
LGCQDCLRVCLREQCNRPFREIFMALHCDCELAKPRATVLGVSLSERAWLLVLVLRRQSVAGCLRSCHSSRRCLGFDWHHEWPFEHVCR